MRKILDVAGAYKLVLVKGFLLIIIPAVMLFDSYTETWSQADWDKTTSFIKIRLGVKMFIASASAFLGLIDKSVGRAEVDLVQRKQKRKDETAPPFPIT